MDENKIGIVLKIIGVVIIFLGIIGAIVCGSLFPSVEYSSYFKDSIEEYNWGLAIALIVCSFSVGMAFLGFGEIINLLQQILNVNTAPKNNSLYYEFECPSCKAGVTKEMNFCPSCGNEFDWKDHKINRLFSRK